MVIKTEVCAFSDIRIYPGHGVRFIRRDGQVSEAMSRSWRPTSQEPYNFVIVLGVTRPARGGRKTGLLVEAVAVSCVHGKA